MAQLYDANSNPFLTDVVQQTQSLGSLNATNSVQLRGQATATVQVTGIGSMTLTFEGTTDGSNFDPIFATPIAGGAPVSTTTTNGHWVNINVTGLFVFRVRVSAFTSGTATVSVIVSQGAPSSNYTTGGLGKIDIASENGTALGTPTNFGTTPGAVAVLGANASLFVGTTAVTGAIAGAPDVNAKGWGGTALGTPTNFGTTPGAVVAGSVNSSTFIGTTAAVAASAGVQKVGITGNAAATLDQANGSAVPTNGLMVGGGSVAGGTNFTVLTVKAASTAAAATDTSLVVQPLVGSAVMSTAASGVQKVGISGATAATLDSVTTAATTPANALAVSVANVTTAPSLTTGQSVAAQGDYQGSLFVKPYRRGQTVRQATTISATGATTILAAQAAGIFADISTLIISVTPQATTASSFTATLSDGTFTCIFDFIAQVTTANGTTPPAVLIFDPPLTATTAATAWTLNLSATNTVHVTVNAVLQKAS